MQKLNLRIVLYGYKYFITVFSEIQTSIVSFAVVNKNK